MSTQAVTVVGLVFGFASIFAFVYWYSHGDLLAAGAIAAGSLIGGVYTLTRGRVPTVPPTTSDDGSRLEDKTPAEGNTSSPPPLEHPAHPAVPASRSVMRLASLLVTEKGYKQQDPGTFGFLGRRRHWGSHAWIALVDANELDVAGINRFVEPFYDLVWNDVSLIGTGAYGILCFVFEDTPSPEIVGYIRSLKRAADPTKGNWMVYWTIVLATGRVITHDGAPWGLFPGRAYLEKAIRKLAPS